MQFYINWSNVQSRKFKTIGLPPSLSRRIKSFLGPSNHTWKNGSTQHFHKRVYTIQCEVKIAFVMFVMIKVSPLTHSLTHSLSLLLSLFSLSLSLSVFLFLSFFFFLSLFLFLSIPVTVYIFVVVYIIVKGAFVK